jgi:hypothetical protein
MWVLTSRATHTVRDLDPADKLNFFRLRMKHQEILAAPGPGYLVVVIQSWEPTDWKGGIPQ